MRVFNKLGSSYSSHPLCKENRKTSIPLTILTHFSKLSHTFLFFLETTKPLFHFLGLGCFDHFKGYELVSKKPLVTCRCRKRNGAEEGYSCRWDGLADMRCECKFLSHSNTQHPNPFYINVRKDAVDYVNYL